MSRDPSRWVVDDLRETDQPAWTRLHGGYLDFYESTRPEEVSAVVWAWLMDPAHELQAIVARSHADADPVGIAHFRPFVRPLQGSTACFLDDLFVAPEHRGGGVVDALLAGLQDRSRQRGWSQVRWITRASNERARKAYDRLAVETDLVTYNLEVD